jgi:RNA polymerase sigma-70 factor (ECF subfamily)
LTGNIAGGTLTEDCMQEHTLIGRLKAGDHRAIDEIIEIYKNPLFSFIVRMVSNFASAEDIFQETWVKVIRYIGKFRGDAKFSTWLFQIALNQCRDTLRKEKRMIHVPIEDYENFLHYEPKTDPYRIIKAQKVRNIVAELPVKMKEVVILRYFHDMNEYEISEVVGSPVGTVKSRLYRASEIIRKKWKLSER